MAKQLFKFKHPHTGQTHQVLATPEEIATIKNRLAAAASGRDAFDARDEYDTTSTPVFPGSGMHGQFANSAPNGTNPGLRMGWLTNVFNTLTKSGRFVSPLDSKTEIFVGNNQPLTLAYPDASRLVSAANTAVAGKAEKVYNQAAWAGADLLLPAIGAGQTTTKTFAARIRITDNIINFKYAPITINLVENASSTPLVKATFVVIPRALPVDLVCLAISNSTGTATVVGFDDIGIQVLAAANPGLVTSDVFYVEGLNARDIGTAK